MSYMTKTFEFPKALEVEYAKAVKYEWISLIYMISATFLSYSVMSNSQTMKTVWLEDMLGIIPPLSFLISSKIVKWNPDKNFPYGFHKITSAAYLTSSLALFVLGIYLLCDGFVVLLKQEHPSIPNVFIFGHSIWLGYFMILALLWSSIPSTILGYLKIPLAHALYEKILYADSKMNKASWMSGFASIFGIIGIGLGFWWADAVTGILISLDIMKDGFSNLKQSTLDLLNEIPKTIDTNKTDPLISQVKSLIKKENWVKSVTLRFRDEGHVFFGDIIIVPKQNEVSAENINTLHDKIIKHHWRLYDIVIMVIPSSKARQE